MGTIGSTSAGNRWFDAEAVADILQNTLAGLLLLFRQPFEIGDVIEVGDHKGHVEAITIRETRLKTFDGRRVLIPNSDVYQSAILVQTAYEQIRSGLIVGVDYTSDLATARKVALTAITGVEGVLADPCARPRGRGREGRLRRGCTCRCRPTWWSSSFPRA